MADRFEDHGFDEDAELGDHDLVVLEQEDGSRLECVVLAVIEHEGQSYALLTPRTSAESEEDDEEEDDVLVATWAEDEAGAVQLGPVDDERVLAALEGILEHLLGVAPQGEAPHGFGGPVPEA